MCAAPAATIAAKAIRPMRESGVVFGSEIMKNVNSSSEPLSRRWMGMVIGSPSHRERATRTSTHAAMKAQVTSARAARLTTSPPTQTIRKAKKATLPHCPGDTHTCLEQSIRITSAKFVGLKTCFPLTRIRNLLPTAIAAAMGRSAGSSLRNSSARESAEMAALRGSNGTPVAREQTHCVISAATSSTSTCHGLTSNPSTTIPYVNRVVSAAIW